MWRNRFGRGFGPVVWQITDDHNDDDDDDDDDDPNVASVSLIEMSFFVLHVFRRFKIMRRP